MANTIDTSYFFGDLGIAQISQASVVSSLQLFIDKYEPELLTQLLGYELYKAYNAWDGSAAGIYKDLRDGKEYTNRFGVLDKWRGLKYTDGTSKKSLIANFVYYWYMRNEATTTAGAAEVAGNAQNASPVSSAHKQCRAWNQMAEWNKELLEFLLSNESSYPEFTRSHFPMYFDTALLRPINQMNL